MSRQIWENPNLPDFHRNIRARFTEHTDGNFISGRMRIHFQGKCCLFCAEDAGYFCDLLVDCLSVRWKDVIWFSNRYKRLKQRTLFDANSFPDFNCGEKCCLFCAEDAGYISVICWLIVCTSVWLLVGWEYVVWFSNKKKTIFGKKLGIWPNQRTPPPLPVSWAAKKKKKSLMFIFHCRLF